MKVAFIAHYTNLYGANRSLLNLIDGLQSYDVIPYVIAPSEGNLIDALIVRNVKYAIIPIRWWVTPHPQKNLLVQKLWQSSLYRYEAAKRLYKNLREHPSLVNQIKAWNADIVYSNSSVIPSGALAAKQLNLPHIWHLREFIDLDYNLYYDWGKGIFNYFLNQAQAKIAISKAIYYHFHKESSTEDFHVIYNGIALRSQFEVFREKSHSLRDAKKPFTFALVGFIHPTKGQETTIKALALLVNFFPNIRLLIVGKGDSTLLKELASELSILDKVEFWGHIDDPYEAYFASDVVLMCSKSEAMGRVTVEAMSACRPVIGYDNAGTSEIIQHEYTGLLYKGGHEALASCMQKCIANPDWVKILGENAWFMARQNYNTEIYAEKIYQVLLSILKRKFNG